MSRLRHSDNRSHKADAQARALIVLAAIVAAAGLGTAIATAAAGEVEQLYAEAAASEMAERQEQWPAHSLASFAAAVVADANSTAEQYASTSAASYAEAADAAAIADNATAIKNVPAP